MRLYTCLLLIALGSSSHVPLQNRQSPRGCHIHNAAWDGLSFTNALRTGQDGLSFTKALRTGQEIIIYEIQK